jgi:hypothetical protein
MSSHIVDSWPRCLGSWPPLTRSITFTIDMIDISKGNRTRCVWTSGDCSSLLFSLQMSLAILNVWKLQSVYWLSSSSHPFNLLCYGWTYCRLNLTPPPTMYLNRFTISASFSFSFFSTTWSPDSLDGNISFRQKINSRVARMLICVYESWYFWDYEKARTTKVILKVWPDRSPCEIRQLKVTADKSTPTAWFFLAQLSVITHSHASCHSKLGDRTPESHYKSPNGVAFG